MNTLRPCLILFCVALTSTVAGCALLSKGDPGAARYFSLERASDGPVAIQAEATGEQGEPPELRLGRITGAPHLEERLVFRDSAFEIRFHRELRWTEPPELFLKRRLARVLFEERGLRQVVGGAAPTLDVQLIAFDEVRVPRRLARVQLVARLHDEHLVLWEETLTVDAPIVEEQDGDLALETVEALGKAMQAAVVKVANRVFSELDDGR